MTKTLKNWRQKQAEEFGRRLQQARKKAGYSTRLSAVKDIPAGKNIASRTYYSHERGERLPEREDTLQCYCDLFGVSRAFLLDGERGEAENDSDINHMRKGVDEKSSILEFVRYIPIIRVSEIEKIITGKGALADMTKDFLPVPSSLLVGPNAFAYEISLTDESMVGKEGRTFLPGSFVIIDPDREIIPGKYALVQFGGADPCVRQLQSSRSFKKDEPHYPINLVANNTNFTSIRVQNDNDCTILGRVVFTISEI